ncbi:MAG: hypothetical protein E6G58_02315 [Actinobacteria bacterium]|nr:MAG: hypothetical protein E6G58_02315 [Actinomycetota bacterium]
MTVECLHGMNAATCAICNPTPKPARVLTEYVEQEQDAIARFVRANARDMLDPQRHNDWEGSVSFTALCDAIPRHSPESIALQVRSMSSMIGLGRGMNVQTWMAAAWERTA